MYITQHTVLKCDVSTTNVAFLCEPVLLKLFTKFNTAIPSSDAVERLLTTGKDILRAKIATLSDANFEKLMFMKGNDHHVETSADGTGGQAIMNG